MDDTPITPLAVPSEARTLIVFGGTFDPPHLGHVKPAVEARILAGLHEAWLVYVPAARSPHKSSGPVFSDTQRVELLRLAIDGLDRAAVWTDELDRAKNHSSGQATYTIDTLRRLKTVRPDATLRLLIGADQALALHRWRNPKDVVALAPPLIMLRGDTGASAEQLARALRDIDAWSPAEHAVLAASITPVTPVTASATAIRAALAGGGLTEDTRRMLAPGVSWALERTQTRNKR